MKAFTFTCVFLTLAASAALQAQTTTGQITGTVQDASRAAVPEAQVAAIQVDTGLKREAKTDDRGYYSFPLMPPGAYRVTVQKEGFRPVSQTGIRLSLDEVARVDLMLEVGAVAESIEVKASAIQVDRETAALGTVMESSKILNLPLNSRNPFALALLAPGVLPGRGFGDLFNTAAGFRINGGRANSNEILIDGVTNVAPAANPIAVVAILPSPDALEEFKIQTNSYAAEYGRSGGGVVNMLMRSGTNKYHGSAFEFLRNSKLDANDFFANRAGTALGTFQRHQFGFTLGAPAVKDKLFYFVNYEGLRQRTASNINPTVPTALERKGDFSQSRQIVANACLPTQIYDPVTTRRNPAGTGFVRDAFPGNVIPATRQDGVGSRMTQYYPLPTSSGAACSAANNFFSAKKEQVETDQFNAKVDWNASSRNKFFTGINWRSYERAVPNHFGTIADSTGGQGGDRIPGRGARLDYTRIQTPSFLLNFRAGAIRLERIIGEFPANFHMADVGFPAALENVMRRPLSFPRTLVTGYAGLGRNGEADYTFQSGTTYSWNASATWVRSNHTVKFGLDTRVNQSFEDSGFGTSGDYSFARSFTQGPDPNAPRADRGNGVASLLLGTGTGFVQVLPPLLTSNNYTALYFQDDFRVTPRLTVNIGLRWDVENGRKDRFNQLSYFDFDAASPLAQKSGLANLRGGLRFTSKDSPRQFDTDWNNFGPRLGIAYSLNSSTVIRSGYGIFYLPYVGMAVGGASGNNGFLANTAWVSSLDGLTPVNYFSNPFPGGIEPNPSNPTPLVTATGQNLGSVRDGAIERFARVGYTQQWNFNIQRVLAGNLMLEAAYIGSKGTKLMDNGWQLNQLTAEQLALGSRLQELVPNPLVGSITSGALAQPTVTRGQLLRPYPQFLNVLDFRPAAASSIYHAAQFRLQKQFAHGSGGLISYTTGTLIDDSAGATVGGGGPAPAHQNAYDRRSDRSVSSQDTSQRFVTSAVYALPFGRGRSFGNAIPVWIDKAFGGWRANAILTFATSVPLALTAPNNSNAFSDAQRPNVNGDPALPGGRSTTDKLLQWFDTTKFSQPAAYTFGSTGRTLPNVRGDGTKNLDLSLFKEFPFMESRRLEFRAEAFNLTNTPQFELPNLAIGNSNFGVVTGQYNNPRQIQLGIKLVF